jgi:hypothetical protein
MEDWCPLATPDQIPGCSGAGAMTGGEPKILHHVTEGLNYAGARTTYAVTHNLPHLTFTYERRVFEAYQHLPLSVAATALVHNGGETNRDNVIQIEWVGFSSLLPQGADPELLVANWPAAYYVGAAHVCRWIEAQTGCRPAATVTLQGARYGPWPGRLDWPAWNAYSGHLCHVHAPENDHYDCGTAFRLDLVTAAPAGAAPSPPPAPPTQGVQHMEKGYVLLGADGGLFTFGDAASALVASCGTAVGRMKIPGEFAVDLKFTRSGQGYWIATSVGGVFGFGDAQSKFFGSATGIHFAPGVNVVELVPTDDEGGYWLIASDGGVFTFGNAAYAGSMGGQHLNAPVLAAEALP